MTQNKKVAILYGWAEGRGHSAHLRKQLRQAGFSLTRKVAQADAIIAHSGGVFLIPEELKAEVILLVGAPYWPGKHPRKSLAEKMRAELKGSEIRRYLLKKTMFNVIHTVSKPRHLYRIWQNWKRDRYPAQTAAMVVAVRNQHDTFSEPEKILKFADENGWEALSLPGSHDDLWLHPERYVAILIAHLHLE